MITALLGHDYSELITDRLKTSQGIEESEISFILNTIKGMKVIVDVGANIGIHSINYAHSNPEAVVYSIEPSIENINILNKNIDKHNITNIRITQCGMGATNSPGTIFINKANCGDNRAYQTSDFSPVSSYPIEIITLDAFKHNNNIDKIDYIKMDTQGCELDIFEGGIQTLIKDEPTIFMEFWPRAYKQKKSNIEAFVEVINRVGYNIYHITKNANLEQKEISSITSMLPGDDDYINLFLSKQKR